MQHFNINQQNLDSILQQHKLSHKDYEKIQEIMQRTPNLIELGIFSAMWSEHCSYKSSKIYLKGFPTKAAWVLQGPGENAGVIDIGDNLAAVFKIESHNHPSFIEPNAGAATGVGGILRDIFTMGANPIANLNSIRFGNILEKSVKKKHIYLLHGVVEGIGHYGNCMGIPTIGGETSFESCYNGNILVNAFSLGIAKQDEIFYGQASGDGNPIMYVGSKTGRDGLGGAVMSSDTFGSNAKSLRPTVQIGDPFVEKLLLEACLEVFRENLIIGIQDMGAAGLTSSSFEMASRSGSGMVLWLDKIPMRESNMNPYELMLSESQERMLLCAKKGCEKRIQEIFAKYELNAEVVGEVCNTGRMELFWYGEKCADLEISALVENAPLLHREVKKPTYLDTIQNLELMINNLAILDSIESTQAQCDSKHFTQNLDSKILESKNLSTQTNFDSNTLESNDCSRQTTFSSIFLESKGFCTHAHIDSKLLESKILQKVFREMLKSLEICDKAWIYNQYDSSIQASTIKASGMLDSSIIALHNYHSNKALAINAKCNVRYCYLNPKIGAKIAVAQSGRNVALSGAKPLAITDCLNFGSPENPEVMYQFRESCEGIKEACLALQTPVVSGNVSLYNQTNNEAIYPTPSVVCVGLLDDYKLAIGSHFVHTDSLICRIGVNIESYSFAGSLLQKLIGSPLSGELKDINLESELHVWELLQEAIQHKLIISAKDIGTGGFAMALAKMAVVGKKGIEAFTEQILQDIKSDNTQSHKHLFSHHTCYQKICDFPLTLFSENQTQIICEVSAQNLIALATLAHRKNLEFEIIGKVGGDTIKIHTLSLSLEEAQKLYYESFETYIKD